MSPCISTLKTICEEPAVGVEPSLYTTKNKSTVRIQASATAVHVQDFGQVEDTEVPIKSECETSETYTQPETWTSLFRHLICRKNMSPSPELHESLNVNGDKERKISSQSFHGIPHEPEVVIRERKISNINVVPHHHVHPHHQLEIEKKVHDQLSQRPEGTEKKGVKIRKSAQVLSAFAANMGAFALGTVMAWSATGIPSLRASGDLGEISKSQESWIGSIVTLAAVVSCPVAAYAMVTFGRRRTMLLLTGPFVFGWACIAFAEILPSFLPKIYTIYFGRVLTGFCGGSYSIIVPVFIAESSHEKLRGALASGFDLMLSVGMLYIYVIGAYASWQAQALACGIIPLVCHGLMVIVSESPRFLVEQGEIVAASQALSWLYGLKMDNLTMEVSMLAKSVEESQAKPVNFDRVVLKMSVLKPILICATIMFFYTMCAYDAVIFYAVDIFKSTGSTLDPTDSAIILGIVQVIATIPATIIVEKCGRRLLLLVSEFLLATSLIAMGLFFFLVEEDSESDTTLHMKYSWLPLTALNIFIIGYSIGLGPLSMVLIGEVCPSHIKGMTTCISLMIRWLLGFGVTNLFESLESSIGADKTYWIFASMCASGLIFVYVCVPETKGKSLDDIQVGFVHKSKLKALQLQQEQQQQQNQGEVCNNNLNTLNNFQIKDHIRVDNISGI